MLVTPYPRAGGEVANCTQWYQAQSYTSCEGILAFFDLTFEQFYKWNPAIGSDCTTMAAGTYYCVWVEGTETPEDPTETTAPPPSSTSGGGVVTPTPTQEGMVDGCTKFHKCVDGDGCDTITEEYGISFKDFVKWNPDIGDECLNMWLNYYVCVGVDAANGKMRF